MQNISNLLSDEQDEAAVRKILPKVTELLTKDEVIEYIAVQKRPVINISPDAIVITNRRFIVVRPRLLGLTFQDVPWREVGDVHMSEQMLGATITCRTIAGAVLALECIPKKQARRVYGYAQQVEEQAYEKRQQIELEKLRASAGGVVLHGVAPVAHSSDPPALPVVAADDPVQALGSLKRLLDAGLISQDEFSAKKAEILARL